MARKITYQLKSDWFKVALFFIILLAIGGMCFGLAYGLPVIDQLLSQDSSNNTELLTSLGEDDAEPEVINIGTAAQTQTAQTSQSNSSSSINASNNTDSNNNVNPFSIQYYANYKEYDTASGASGGLTTINTTKNTIAGTAGLGGRTPLNRDSSTITSNNEIFIALDTSVSGNRKPIKYKSDVLTKMYKNKTVNLSGKYAIENLSVFRVTGENPDYKISKIWVLKTEGAEESTSESDWYVFSYVDGMNVEVSNEITEPTVVDNTLKIKPSSVVRIVYDETASSEVKTEGTLFDYDITDCKVYSDYNCTTEITKQRNLQEFKTQPYTKWRNSAGVFSGIHNYLGSVSDNAGLTFGQNYYTKGTWYSLTHKDSSGEDYKKKYNSFAGDYRGLSFGLAKAELEKASDGNNTVVPKLDVAAPNLFTREAESADPRNTTGKFYRDGQGVFETSGFGRALKYIQADDETRMSSDLTTFQDNDSTSGYLWSNMCWAADRLWDMDIGNDESYWQYHDQPSGTSKNYVLDYRDLKDGSIWYSPRDDEVSTTSTDVNDQHNAYFALTSTVDFSLTDDYVGPLKFLFYGDDDMWLYLTEIDTDANGNETEDLGSAQLICDIGGVHLSAGELVDLRNYLPASGYGGKYRLRAYYIERGDAGSVFYVNYFLPSTTAFNYPNKTYDSNTANGADGAEVEVGDVITYDINYMNSNDEAVNLTITDTMSKGLKLEGKAVVDDVEIELTSEKVNEDGSTTYTWIVENVPAQTADMLIVKGKVTSDVTSVGKVTNIATVSNDPGKTLGPVENPSPVKGVDVVGEGTETEGAFADDGLAVEIGDVVNYKVDSGIISDAISATEKSVVFSDVIQKGLTLGEYNATSSTWDTGLVVKYKVDGGSEQTLAPENYNTTDSTINPGEEGDGTKSFIVNINQTLEANTEIWIEFKCTINDDAKVEVVNTGHVAVDSHGEADTNTVKNPLPKKSVDVTKTGTKTYEGDGQEVAVGDVVTYKVDAGNISKDMAEVSSGDPNIKFEDAIQTGLTYGEASSGLYTDSLKVYSLAKGATTPTLLTTGYNTTGSTISAGTPGKGTEATKLIVNVTCAIAADTQIWIEFGCTVNAEAQTHNKVTNESTITILNYGSATPAEVDNPVPVKAVDVVGKYPETEGTFADDGKNVEVEDVVRYKVSSGLIEDDLTYSADSPTIVFSDPILKGLTLGKQEQDASGTLTWKENLSVWYKVGAGTATQLEEGKYSIDSTSASAGTAGNDDKSVFYKVNINTDIAANTLMWIEFDCTVNTDAPSTSSTDPKVIDTGHVVVLNHGEADTNTTTNPIYVPTPTSNPIPVTKTLSSQNKATIPSTEITWNFEISAVGVIGRVGGNVPLPSTTTLSITTKGSSVGPATFGAITYSRSGVYHYQIKETSTSSATVNQDWYCDAETYDVYVNVVEDTTTTPGTLSVEGLYKDDGCTQPYTAAGVEFTNVYMPPSKQYSESSDVKSQDTKVKLGTTIIYTLYWANYTAEKKQVYLRDIPSKGLTYTSATTTPTDNQLTENKGDGSSWLQWDLGETDPGTCGNLDVTFVVNSEVTVEKGVQNDAKISFDNTSWRDLQPLHNPFEAEGQTTIAISKKCSTGSKCDVPDGATFEFTCAITGVSGGVSPESSTKTVKTEYKAGTKEQTLTVDFGTFKFVKAGSYTATITETTPSDTHWTAKTETQTIAITATETEGKLVITKNPDPATITFENVFSPDSIKVPISVTKEVTAAEGYSIPEGKEFTFTAKLHLASSQEVLATKLASITTKAGQSSYTVSFDEFELDTVGVYLVDITEDQPTSEDKDWTYDSTTKTVKVTISGDSTSKLSYTLDPVDPTTFKFTNIYAPSAVSVPIKVTKKTTAAEGTGGVPVGKTFNFVATEEHSGVTQSRSDTITTTADKDTYTVNLSSFSFSFAGDYSIKISETKPSAADGWDYDTQLLREVKVNVKTEEGGKLSYTTDPADPTTIVYTNKYNPTPAKVPLTVKKVVESTLGTILAGKTFDFAATCNGQTLYASITTESAESAKAEYAVKFDGEFSFAAVGDYTIKITETTKTSAGWICDSSTKEVAVNVKSSATGATLSATINPEDPSTAIVFTNKYDPVPAPANYSLRKVIEVLQGEIPDGKQFSFAYKVDPSTGVTPTSGVASVVTRKGCTLYDIALGDFSFTLPGSYAFTVTETSESEEWWISDPEPVRKFDVEVVPDVDGHLYATADPDPGTLTYVNSYFGPETPEPEVAQGGTAQSGDAALFAVISFCCIAAIAGLILLARKQLNSN